MVEERDDVQFSFPCGLPTSGVAVCTGEARGPAGWLGAFVVLPRLCPYMQGAPCKASTHLDDGLGAEVLSLPNAITL